MNIDAWMPAETPNSSLVSPWSWVFASVRRAMVTVLVTVPLSWVLLVLMRFLIWPKEPVFWSHELCLVATFTFAGALTLLLSQRFHELQHSLAGKSPELDKLLAEQATTFHRRRWLVLMPPVLSAIAVSLRYFCLDYLTPFESSIFDGVFLAWLFAGFCLILNATVLVGLYTEIVRQLGDAARRGLLTRHDISMVSLFFLRIAILASIYFALAAIAVSALDVLYAWNGVNWPGYQVLRELPAWLLRGDHKPFTASMEAIFEAIFISGLYLAACCASLLYFFLPQWGIHRLLVERKRAVLDQVERDLDVAETAMLAHRDAATIEKYAHLSQTHEQLLKIPEWPISGGGMVGTLMLLGIPGALVLFREVLVNLFASLLVR